MKTSRCVKLNVRVSKFLWGKSAHSRLSRGIINAIKPSKLRSEDFFCQQIHQMVIERFYGNQSKRLITWIVCNVQSISLTALSISFLQWFSGTFHLAKTTGLKLREEFASSFRLKSLFSLSNAKIQQQYPRWMFLFVIPFYAHHYLHVWLKNVWLFSSIWRYFGPFDCFLLIYNLLSPREVYSASNFYIGGENVA